MTGPHHLDWCGWAECGDPSHARSIEENERARGAFVEQGYAAGYDQGWNDAKAGRPYGTTPACGQPTSDTRVEAPLSARSGTDS